MAGSYESHVPAHRSLGRIARIGLACVFSAFCVLIKDFLHGFIKHKVPKYDSGSLYVSRRQIKYSKYRASRALSQGTISLSLSLRLRLALVAPKKLRGVCACCGRAPPRDPRWWVDLDARRSTD